MGKAILPMILKLGSKEKKIAPTWSMIMVTSAMSFKYVLFIKSTPNLIIVIAAAL